ncbi:MAG: hypothetical protein Q9195_002003 [Heterodermia aff. obscurata]
MATGKKTNEELKASELFDVSALTAVVTGGGTGIGLTAIARDNNTRFSVAGKPDFKSAQSISQHLMQSEPEEWQETFNTNLTGQFFVTAALLPLLEKGRDSVHGYTSSVINVASISGVMKGTSSGQFAYATSKAGKFFSEIVWRGIVQRINPSAGFIHLTRMMATTFAETRIRVNCIAPGIFPSEMTAGSSGDDQKSTLDMEMTNPAGTIQIRSLPERNS